MPKRRHRRSGGGTAATAGIAILAIVIAALLGGLGYFKWQASQHVALDPKTYCPVTGPGSATAVLLDLTDAISATTLQDLKNRFQDLVPTIPEGGLLAIYGLTEHPGELIRLFDACNPGDGSNVDPITSNPKLARQRWEEGYHRPFDRFMSDLGTHGPAARSPIMAGIQQIKLTLFDSQQARNIDKRLVVVSDMIEHTDVYSQYKSGFGYDAFERSRARDMFRTSLKDVPVTVLFIPRLKLASDPADRADFWAKWFQVSGAADVKIVRLEGVN
jgi:hypothetical protein